MTYNLNVEFRGYDMGGGKNTYAGFFFPANTAGGGPGP